MARKILLHRREAAFPLGGRYFKEEGEGIPLFSIAKGAQARFVSRFYGDRSL